MKCVVELCGDDWNVRKQSLKSGASDVPMAGISVVGQGRLELPTYGLGNHRSVQLSYCPVKNDAYDTIVLVLLQ